MSNFAENFENGTNLEKDIEYGKINHQFVRGI